MSEKFDLKRANSLLPRMTDNEDVTKQLVDAISLYDELLDVTGKLLLTKFVLKTKLSQNAKLRLQNNYASNLELINDINKH